MACVYQLPYTVFKAHSVRGAASTHVYITAVPISQILKMADWTSERTFCITAVSKGP